MRCGKTNLYHKGHGGTQGNSTRLLAFLEIWHVEIDAALFVGLCGSLQVEIGERNFLLMLRGEVPQGLADDGIILHLFFVSIAENQDCIGDDLRRVHLAGCPRRWWRRPLISVLIILFAHSLLVEALRVHFVRYLNLVLLILIVGRAGIPPPVGIERASVPPGITKAATPEAEAVAPEAITTKIPTAEII